MKLGYSILKTIKLEFQLSNLRLHQTLKTAFFRWRLKHSCSLQLQLWLSVELLNSGHSEKVRDNAR